MKLSAHIERLQSLLTEHGDLDLIYSKDDEGNGYNTVNYLPSAMRYDEHEREAYNLHTEDNDFIGEYLPKVICVN
jgi:hypothetical protein